MAPSAEPAPTIVCSSSIKRITFFERTNLIHHGLDSLFELATIFCPGYHEREIERDDAFIAQQFEHIASRDFLSQPFDDGGLSVLVQFYVNVCFYQANGLLGFTLPRLRTKARERLLFFRSGVLGRID